MKNKVIFIFVFFFYSNSHPQLMNWKELGIDYLDRLEISTSGDIYAVSNYYRKVYKSTDNGTIWSQLPSIYNEYVTSVSVKGSDTILVGSEWRLYISTNTGESFDYITYFHSAIRCIKSKDISGVNYIVVGTDSGGISISTDFGLTWQTKLTDIKYFEKIAFSGNNILAKTMNNGLYLSQDFGSTWNKKVVNAGMPWIYDVETVEGDSAVFVSAGGIYKSTNNGIDWNYLANISADCIAYSPLENQLFAGKYLSEDMGLTWRVVCWFNPTWIAIKDSTTFLANRGDIFREEHTPRYIYKGNNFFPLAVGNKWQYIKTSNGLGTSTSYNLSTTEVLSDTILNGKHCFWVYDDGTYNFLHYSEENKLFLESSGIEKLLMDFNLLGKDEFYFYDSTRASVNEGPVSLFGYERYYKGLSSYYFGVPFYRNYVDSIGVYYYYIYDVGAGGYSKKKRLDLIEASVKIQDSTFVYKVNYSPTVTVDTIRLVSDWILCLRGTVSHPHDIIADSPLGSLFFTDTVRVEYFITNGADTICWGSKDLYRLANTNSFSDSIYYSNSLYNKGCEIKYRFILTDKGIIHKTSIYPESGYLSFKLDPVDVGKENELFLNYELFQNYPNPFNPSTVISWQLAVGSHVTLKIYDVLGNEIATLVNEEQKAGTHNYEFEMRNYELSGGVYYYRLKAGNFVETKGMIYLK